jgi:uncharacterized protein YoxC
MKTIEDTKFRDRVISTLSRTETEIKAIKTDTERIINRLDDLSIKVQDNEQKISKINGVMTLVFVFFGTVLALMGFYK